MSNAHREPLPVSQNPVLELLQYLSQRELHRHTCPKCKHTWIHRASDFKNESEYAEGHTCSQCREPDVRIKEDI